MNPAKNNFFQNFMNRQITVFFGLLLLAFIVRLLGIISRPIWYDEAFSILFSEKGPTAMLAGTLSATGPAAEEHPLAYYTMFWLWMKVFGESLVAVRILSITAGLGTVCGIYFLAYKLFNVKTAQVAALFMALSPFEVHYSQEIRMYVFLAFWLVLATYAYWRAVQSKLWGWWLGFAIFAALAQYTHNLAAFYLIALALWPLIIRDWRSLKAVIAAGLLAMLLYLPWLVHLPAQFAKVDQAYWIDKPGLYRLFTLLLYFVTNLPLPNSWLMPGLFIALLVVAIAMWQTIQATRQKQADVQPGLWMLYLTFAPPILLFLFSQWKAIYLERALLPSGTIFCIWLAWALIETKLPRAIQWVTLALLLIGFGMGV
jgi:mannosyltransferase